MKHICLPGCYFEAKVVVGVSAAGAVVVGEYLVSLTPLFNHF